MRKNIQPLFIKIYLGNLDALGLYKAQREAIFNLNLNYETAPRSIMEAGQSFTQQERYTVSQ